MPRKNVNNFFLKKSRKPMGRPKLLPKDRRSENRGISFQPHEVVQLDAMARQAGKTFSTWAREVLLAAVDAI